MFFLLSSYGDLVLECKWAGELESTLTLWITRATPQADLFFGTLLNDWPIEGVLKPSQRLRFRDELKRLRDDVRNFSVHPTGFAIRHFGVFEFETLLLGDGAIPKQVSAIHLPSLLKDGKPVVFLRVHLEEKGDSKVRRTQESRDAVQDISKELTPDDSVSCAGAPNIAHSARSKTLNRMSAHELEPNDTGSNIGSDVGTRKRIPGTPATSQIGRIEDL
eukprot:gnl/MRDRNA2_/MRDRNA2_85391_c0_seq3.p1 gnl/MRDRNA2_/MRDRNA2_85391_c0~~gnl/MRDRNA2_/MRDRNA2_85391_c0_seq3.p1  ORF type:complete len:219 (-),score=23.88 gnl/MRDRNA2_/MRDRNA2_85391_c0_seq3:268-924(-)